MQIQLQMQMQMPSCRKRGGSHCRNIGTWRKMQWFRLVCLWFFWEVLRLDANCSLEFEDISINISLSFTTKSNLRSLQIGWKPLLPAINKLSPARSFINTKQWPIRQSRWEERRKKRAARAQTRLKTLDHEYLTIYRLIVSRVVADTARNARWV